MITNPNIQILEAAAERLRTLTEEMVFAVVALPVYY